MELSTLLERARQKFEQTNKVGRLRRLYIWVFGTSKSYRTSLQKAKQTAVASLEISALPPTQTQALLQEWLRTAGSVNDSSKLLAFSLNKYGSTPQKQRIRQQVEATLTECGNHPACQQHLRAVQNQSTPLDQFWSAVQLLTNNHPNTGLDTVFAGCLNSLLYHYLRGLAFKRAVPKK